MSVLHLFCGKIAAGKSTLAAHFAQVPNSILISQDHWLARLFPGEIKTISDYARCSGRLRDVLGPHIASVLRLGISVSLDFPANTRTMRQWMRTIIADSGADHQLHYLDMTDEACKARLHARNASGQHDYIVTDEEFEQFTSYFDPPSDDEGLNVVIHQPA